MRPLLAILCASAVLAATGVVFAGLVEVVPSSLVMPLGVAWLVLGAILWFRIFEAVNGKG